MAKDYYKILGVDKKATEDEIKSQYRKLVKQYHPDLHPGDEEAAAKFKEINEANEVLSDAQKRAAYDYELEHPYASQGGAGGFDFSGFGGGDGGGFSDIFGDIFSQFTGGGSARTQRGQTKGADITIEVSLSFLDAAKGCTKEVTYNRREPCAACKGTGAKDGTSYTTCPKCKGTGQVQFVSGGGFFRTVTTRECPDCGGTGKKITEKCTACNGKGYTSGSTTYKFNVPAGADTNSYIQKRGMGQASMNGGEAGDLIIVFKVLPHKLFKRKEFDLYVEVPVSFATAALGGKVKVPTLDAPVDVDIPEGTQSGKVIMVRGKGIRGRLGNGNLYVTVIVEVPSKLSKAQKAALTEFNDGLDIKQSSKMNDYSKNVQSLYGVDPYNK